MKDIIYHKSRTVEISKYENPDFYDDFVWSFEYASSMPFKVVRAIMEMLGVIASLVTIGVVIVSLDMSAAIFVAVLAIIGIVAKLLTAKAELKKDEDLVPVNRELDYVNRVLFLDTYAKELRMNKIRQLFLDKYDGFVDAQKKISLKKCQGCLLGELYFLFVERYSAERCVLLVYVVSDSCHSYACNQRDDDDSSCRSAHGKRCAQFCVLGDRFCDKQ